MGRIETDYLVVGAGAAAMAFTDALVTECDADVVMVDRRHRPGGHWNDAYPFVQLHQPSAFYGVNSRMLGHDTIDAEGPNAGFYERATSAQIVDYFQAVLDEQFLPSGRVRFFGMSDYQDDGAGGHTFTSRLTGETTNVTVRRRLVDATYQETFIPSTQVPGFGIDPGVRLIPVNDLVKVDDAGTGFTVLGGGKTAMDACSWLLDRGVAPESIRWIRPRDAWLLDREYQQPLERVPRLIEGISLNLEAAAAAESIPDLFARLEACGQLVRLDSSVDPTMYRCATVSQRELTSLRRITDVVRLGRVAHLGLDRIDLEHGSIPTDGKQIHVDCTADGLKRRPPCAIFDGDRITPQQIRTCQPTFNAALIGFVEASRDDDDEKNRLCPPNPYPSDAVDWITSTITGQRTLTTWLAERDVVAWMRRSRLDAARALGDHMDDPLVTTALTRMMTNAESAVSNLERLLAAEGPVS